MFTSNMRDNAKKNYTLPVYWLHNLGGFFPADLSLKYKEQYVNVKIANKIIFCNFNVLYFYGVLRYLSLLAILTTTTNPSIA